MSVGKQNNIGNFGLIIRSNSYPKHDPSEAFQSNHPPTPFHCTMMDPIGCSTNSRAGTPDSLSALQEAEQARDVLRRIAKSGCAQGARDDHSVHDGNENDTFDIEGLPMPQGVTSTAHIILEIAPRNGGFNSNDPLFQGVCLWDGSMTSNEREKFEFKATESTTSKAPSAKSSWFLPAIFSRTP